MKIIFAIALSFVLATGFGQKMVNPIIKGYGGVYDLPDADVKIDPSLDYKIVIEVARESEKPSDVNWALNNVARLLNLHAMAGVPKENLHVVLAIHRHPAVPGTGQGWGCPPRKLYGEEQ